MEPSLSTRELANVFKISSQRVGKIASLVAKDDDSFLKGRNRFYKADIVQKILRGRGFQYNKKTIIFTTLKGGTGKTTLSLGTARRLTCLGAKVLFIDLDKQANATITLLNDTGDNVLLDIVKGDCSITDSIKKIDSRLDLLPSSLANARLEIELANKKINPTTYYQNLLKPISKNYDYIIIDSPPDLSHSVYLAILASDILVIPVNLDRYSIQGLAQTLSIIKDAALNFSDFFSEIKVVINKYDAREKTALDFLAELKAFKGIEIMPNIIRTDTTFKKAQKAGLPLGFNSNSSNASSDIDAFTKDLIKLDFSTVDIKQ